LDGKRAIDREPACGRPQLRSFSLQAVSPWSHALEEEDPERVGHSRGDCVSQRIPQTDRSVRHRAAIRSQCSTANRGELKLSPGYLSQAKAHQSAETLQPRWRLESWDLHFLAHSSALAAKTRKNQN